MKDFMIHPYQGVGELRFGMHRSSVHSIMGKPALQRKSKFSDEITDYWYENGLQLTFSEIDEELIEISLYPNIKNVTYGELEIFSLPSYYIHQTLCQKDGDPRVTVGVTILLNLGVALAGFQNDDSSDDSITAFASSRWHKDDPDLKPFKLE